MTWNVASSSVYRGLQIALLCALGATGPAGAQVSEDELLKLPERNVLDAGAISLSLRAAQDKAVKSNIALRQSRIDRELAELNYRTAYHTMFLPNVALDGSVSGAYTYGHLPSKKSEAVLNTADQKGYPSTTYTLGLGEYVLYNGGKDSLNYKKAIIDWRRAQEVYRDREREAKLRAIVQFARYQTDNEKRDAAGRYLSLSISLARLIKTRVRLRKATKDEYSSALNDVIEARNNLEEAKVVAEASLWELNKALGDPIGQDYRLEGKLEFRPLKLTLPDAVVLYKANAPSLLEQKANFERRRLELELAQRDRLPTPRVSLSPVKISFTNAYGSSGYESRTAFTTDSDDSNNNLDIGFSVSISIPLFTESGYFKSRTIAAAEKSSAREDLQGLAELQNSDTQIRQYVQQIAKQEMLVRNSQQLLRNSVELLDGIFARLSGTGSAGTSRLELRDSLRSAFQAEIDYREALLQHLSQKFEMAKFLGVDLDENVDF